MNRWYRKRAGWQIGKFVIGYELREYRMTLPVAWPTVYRDPCAWGGDCPACDNPK